MHAYLLCYLAILFCLHDNLSYCPPQIKSLLIQCYVILLSVCACACVHACVCVCVCVHVRAHMCVCVCVYVFAACFCASRHSLHDVIT